MVRGWSILLTATYYSVLLLSLLLLGLDRGALDVDHNAVVVRRTTGGNKSTEFIRSMECINTQVRVVQNHWCLRGRLWTGEGGFTTVASWDRDILVSTFTPPTSRCLSFIHASMANYQTSWANTGSHPYYAGPSMPEFGTGVLKGRSCSFWS